MHKGLYYCNKRNKPIAFAKDGMITRIKVDDFDKQDIIDIHIYEIDRISRHNGAVMKNFRFYINGNALLAMVTIG